jgi:hypothetical protein
MSVVERFFNERADVYKRNPSAGGATYSKQISAEPCYHYPRQPERNEVDEFGQIPPTIYVWVFKSETAIPNQTCISSGGAAYLSISDPILFTDPTGFLGTHKQVLTTRQQEPPAGVTV